MQSQNIAIISVPQYENTIKSLKELKRKASRQKPYLTDNYRLLKSTKEVQNFKSKSRI